MAGLAEEAGLDTAERLRGQGTWETWSGVLARPLAHGACWASLASLSRTRFPPSRNGEAHSSHNSRNKTNKKPLHKPLHKKHTQKKKKKAGPFPKLQSRGAKATAQPRGPLRPGPPSTGPGQGSFTFMEAAD